MTDERIKILMQELEDIEEEKRELFQEALIDAGLDLDDPDLADKFNDMDPEDLSNIIPDTSLQDERIEEIMAEINELNRESEESES